MGALSSEGKAKSYSDDANGFARGEGCGLVFLKRLEDAERDGDRIYAVIKSSSANSDGNLKDGITMPSQEAQMKLLEQVYNEANINPNDILFVEGHGTGTQVGDPIEANAIGRALGKKRSKNSKPLLIGSVKSNIGHLEVITVKNQI